MNKELIAAWKVVILLSLSPETHHTYNGMVQVILGRQCAEAVNHRSFEGPIPAWSFALDELMVSGDIVSWSNKCGDFYKVVKR